MRRREFQAWGVAAAGLIAAAVGWVLVPSRFAQAWLSGMAAFSLWPLGSLALLYAHALTGGRWGRAVRPGLVAGALLTPVLALLAIPVLLSLPALYPWARPEGTTLANHWWLNLPFFFVRDAAALAFWIAITVPVWRGADLSRIAPFALCGLAITVTTAAIDFTMSLDPHFVSSAYGMIAAASAGVVALAAAILLSPGADPEANADLAKILLGLTVLWTYLDFMQLLIVYQSDLATQSPWYLARGKGGAGWVLAGISLLHSWIPFFALLSPSVRRSHRALGIVASLLIAAEIIRAFWTVLPAAPRGPGLVDVAVVLFILAGATAWGIRARERAC